MKKLLNNKKVHLILMIIKAIVSILIFAIVSIIFVQRVSNNKVTLGGYGIYTIISESMAPKYTIGDMIISKKVDTNSIKLYDDVVYIGEKGDFKDKIVTHQVIGIKNQPDNKRTFITKGIANDVEDPEIDQSQIYGKVVYKATLLSLLSKLVNNNYGFYFVIFIPFAIMIFLEVLDTIKDKEKIKVVENKDENREGK